MPEASRAARVANIDAAGATDPGRVRTGNEDRLHLDVERGIFAVADGVGGHAAGEIAASIAVDVIARRLERPLWSPEQRVREAIALANNEILTQAQSAPQYAGMTCVLTLALLTERGLTVGHVGDTRLYTLTADRMVKLTHDHSPIGEREDSGEITEVEAMRHPRRNQVFRDVGSVFHEPHDPDFVEVIEAPFDERSALLLCSDGLSDMLTSAAIERTVRRHAGNPGRVVEALIQAANDEGGRDNITAIYVEGAGFADAIGIIGDSNDAALPAVADVRTMLEAASRRRTTWLMIGLACGLALGFGLAWTLARYPPLSPAQGRTLSVNGSLGRAVGSFGSIADALKEARPRDIVEIEPGEYAESVVLPDGVQLTARTPGRVTLVASPGQSNWVGIIAGGRMGNRISGIRVLGTPEAPLAAGLRLDGHNIQVDDVSVEGVVGVGIDIANDGDITVRASRFSNLEGLPLRIGAGGRPVVRQNQFVHDSGARSPAADVAPSASPDIVGNLFSGYADLLRPPSPVLDTQLREENHVVIAPDRSTTPRRRTP